MVRQRFGQQLVPGVQHERDWRREESKGVLVSCIVKYLVTGSGLTFEDAGEHELKGVPDRWRLYRVVDA
jgi:hypothetical protein